MTAWSAIVSFINDTLIVNNIFSRHALHKYVHDHVNDADVTASYIDSIRNMLEKTGYISKYNKDASTVVPGKFIKRKNIDLCSVSELRFVYNIRNLDIRLIVAMAQNGTIGKNGSMPWHLSHDLQQFKSTTVDNVVIMGRKTFESLHCKTLPNRVNMVVSSKPESIQCPSVSSTIPAVTSLKQALLICTKYFNDKKIFIIGGAKLYKSALRYVKTMHITEINESIDGDTKFPCIDWTNWQLVDESEQYVDTSNNLHYTFKIFKRKYV